MRTSSKSIACPRCGQPATITLSEQIDPQRGTEGHAIELRCSSSEKHEPATELELLRLWAADRARFAAQRGARPA